MPKTLEELREKLSVNLEGGILRADFRMDSDQEIDVWYHPNDEVRNQISAISFSHRRRLIEKAQVIGFIADDSLMIRIGRGKDHPRKYTCETYDKAAFGKATRTVRSATIYFERVMKDAYFRKVSRIDFMIN